MKNTNTYLFDGHLTTEAPFATCSKSLSESRRDTKLDPLPVPTIKTSKGDRMYIPGQGIRSKLRGALTHVAGVFTRENDDDLSLMDAQYLRLGGVKQSGDEAKIDPTKMAKMLSLNPLISLFGAGSPWVTGKAMIGHAIDDALIERGIYEPIVIDGVRASMLRRDHSLVNYLDDESIGALSEIADAVKNSSRIKKQIKEKSSDIRACKDPEMKLQLKEALKEFKNSTEDDITNSEQMPLSGYKAIPPQSTLSHKMRLMGVNQIELGAFIASIAGFADAPVLGAHASHGCGEVSGEWKVTMPGGKEVGTVSFSWSRGLTIEGTELVAARKAFDAAIAGKMFDFHVDKSMIAADAKKDAKKGEGDDE